MWKVDGNGTEYEQQRERELVPVNGNNKLRFIMVKTNRSTLHTVHNIKQSATQGRGMTPHIDCHTGQQQQSGLAQRV